MSRGRDADAMIPVKLNRRVFRGKADFAAAVEEIDAVIRHAFAEGMTDEEIATAIETWIGDIVGRDHPNRAHAHDITDALRYTYGPDRLVWLQHGGHA